MTPPTEMPVPPPVTYEPGQHPDRPPFLELLAGDPIAPPELWMAQDARMEIADGATGTLTLVFDTGRQWGCGTSLFGPRHLARTPGPANTTDMDGYTTLVLEATVPDGVKFEVILDEAGAADGDTSAGDDGESFIYPPSVGTGVRATYRFEIADALARENWGNQQGARRIEMQAMKAVALYFPGSQGDGRLVLHSVRLER